MVWRGVVEQSPRSVVALFALGQTLRSLPHRVVASWL